MKIGMDCASIIRYQKNQWLRTTEVGKGEKEGKMSKCELSLTQALGTFAKDVYISLLKLFLKTLVRNSW